MTRILCIIPPYIPSYFNAGHHLPIFSVANYLRKDTAFEVKALDCAALNSTWKDICDVLIEGFDFIVVMNDFDAIDTFKRFVSYCKELNPTAKLITFGRLSHQIPLFFTRFEFDCIVNSGDYEAGVKSSIDYLNRHTTERTGFFVKEEDNYLEPQSKGHYLNPSEWAFPDIEEIPYAAYDKMYLNDLNKFCGIPERRELVIPIARGCPVNCSFCDVPRMQGKQERRVSVKRVIEYIRSSFNRHPMEYYSFYCPTFTLDRNWVLDFCKSVIEQELIYPWKCVTVAGTLTRDLVKIMSQAGCIRISMGIETLDENASNGLPKVKQKGETHLELVIQWCEEFDIEVNCFIILGLPGDSIEGVRYTVQKILRFNGRVRPTIYTPYHLLREDMTVDEVNNFNRQFFVREDKETISETDKLLYYNLFYNNQDDFETQVMNQIPLRTGELA
ncbi:MAG: radical SAM protein [Bacteroidota bacterium]